MGAQVVVVGSFVQDHCWSTDRFPVVGETRVGKFSSGPGGKGFNQAVACHRQGVSTRFVGALGADAIAVIARQFAQDEGLDCHWQVVENLPTATSSIVVDASAHNLIVVDLAANAKLDAAVITEAIEAGTQVVLTQLETSLEAAAAALEQARAVGAIAVLNPAPMHAGLSPEFLSLADIATPNETEFALLLECLAVPASSIEPWAMDDLDLHALCRATGVPTLVLTLGEHGCFISHGRNRRGDDDAFYRLPREQVQAIDTTGAGDAFSGGLVAALAAQEAGSSFRDAVIYANRVAALSTETVGTAPAMPTRDQVNARFAAV